MNDITPEAARAQAEAALANQVRFIADGWWEQDGELFDGSRIRSDLADAARALLSVFPEPPTTGDREALQAEVDRRYPPYPTTTGWSYEDAAMYEGVREGLLEGLAAGFRRPSPPTDEQIDAAARAMYRHTQTLSVAGARDLFRIGLEAAARVGGAA